MICYHCKQDKAENEFAYKSKATNKRQDECKTCKALYGRQWYQNNKARHIEQTNERKTKIRLENQEKVFEYLLSHPCVDCGESDPVVLEFDHIDPILKEHNIAMMMPCSWKSLEIEIAKCEVRCANCHKRKTAKQFGWAKLFMEKGQAGNGAVLKTEGT